MYTTEQAAAIYNVAQETIRSWCEQFGNYLSPSATPGSGRKRLFADDDMAVLSLISDHRRNGMLFEDIHAALENGQRGQIPNMKPDEIELQLNSENERRLTLQLNFLQTQVKALQDENERLKRMEKDALRSEIRAELLEKQLMEVDRERRELQARINELEREVGRLEGNKSTD